MAATVFQIRILLSIT